MDRRDLLKGLGGLILGAGAAARTMTAADIKPLPIKYEPLGPSPLQQLGDQWIHDEVLELERFAAHPANKDLFPTAISIPFATLPMNIYARLDASRYALPAPKIPVLAGMLERPLPGQQLELAMQLLFVRQVSRSKLPAELMMVEDIPLKVPNISKEVVVRPDRVVSPRFVTDVDEHKCKGGSWNHLAASMLVGMVYGVVQELEAKWLAAKSAVAHNVPCGLFFVYRRPEIYAKREAYMVECFLHMISAGVIYTDNG
jgi:hypothetical protein